MLDMDFSRWLATSNIERRATTLRYGRVAYRLADGSGHVGLDAEQWTAVRAHFAAESTAVARVTRWLQIGFFPVLFLFGITIGQVLPFAGFIFLAALLLGPIENMIRHPAIAGDDRLRENVAPLQVENAKDLERARAAGLAEPLVDRLKLSPKVLETCAEGCEQLAAMPDITCRISLSGLRLATA